MCQHLVEKQACKVSTLFFIDRLLMNVGDQDGSTLIDFATTLCHTGQGTKRTQPQDGAPDPKKPRRRPYCGKCTGCLEKNDCGICANCK